MTFWKSHRLDELGIVSRGRSRHRPRDAAHLYDGPYPFVQTADVKRANLFLTEYEQTYSEAGLEQSKLWPPGTLCITIAANIAETAILGIEACFPDSVIGFISDSDKADVRFIKYLFDTSLKRRFQTFTQGAAQDNLSQSKLLSIRFDVPEVAVQRQVADILAAYDELIENNRRRMALLEDAARNLYREWFIRLRFPGHEHTPLHNGVPQGWEETTLGHAAASLEDGDWIETKDQGGDDFRLIQISNIGANEFVETGNFRFITEETFRRLGCREVKPRQILVSRMPDPIGRAWLVTKMPWPMVTAVDIAILSGKPGYADEHFLTYCLNSDVSLGHCRQRASGGTRPRISRRELAGLPIRVPSWDLQILFREVVASMIMQRANLYEQNEKLVAARDLLLPKMMTGEIAV